MRIRAAVAARDEMRARYGMDIVIIARTDAAQVEGMARAVERLKGAAREGADAVFIEGVRTREEVRDVVKAVEPVPVSVQCFYFWLLLL